jgi:hypothetical protein
MSSTIISDRARLDQIQTALRDHDTAYTEASAPFWVENTEKFEQLTELFTEKNRLLAFPTTPEEAGDVFAYLTRPFTATTDLDGPVWAGNRHAVDLDTVAENGSHVLQWIGVEHVVGDVAAYLCREDTVHPVTGALTVGALRINAYAGETGRGALAGYVSSSIAARNMAAALLIAAADFDSAA